MTARTLLDFENAILDLFEKNRSEVEVNVAAIIVITRAVLPGVIPMAILSPLAIESVLVVSENASVVFAPSSQDSYFKASLTLSK